MIVSKLFADSSLSVSLEIDVYALYFYSLVFIVPLNQHRDFSLYSMLCITICQKARKGNTAYQFDSSEGKIKSIVG